MCGQSEGTTSWSYSSGTRPTCLYIYFVSILRSSEFDYKPSLSAVDITWWPFPPPVRYHAVRIGCSFSLRRCISIRNTGVLLASRELHWGTTDHRNEGNNHKDNSRGPLYSRDRDKGDRSMQNEWVILVWISPLTKLFSEKHIKNPHWKGRCCRWGHSGEAGKSDAREARMAISQVLKVARNVMSTKEWPTLIIE